MSTEERKKLKMNVKKPQLKSLQKGRKRDKGEQCQVHVVTGWRDLIIQSIWFRKPYDEEKKDRDKDRYNVFAEGQGDFDVRWRDQRLSTLSDINLTLPHLLSQSQVLFNKLGKTGLFVQFVHSLLFLYILHSKPKALLIKREHIQQNGRRLTGKRGNTKVQKGFKEECDKKKKILKFN